MVGGRLDQHFTFITFIFLQKKHNCPVMCAYKLVTCEFKVFPLQTFVEKVIQRVSNMHILFAIF